MQSTHQTWLTCPTTRTARQSSTIAHNAGLARRPPQVDTSAVATSAPEPISFGPVADVSAGAGSGVQVATLRIQIDGRWTAQDLVSTFTLLDDAYVAIAALDMRVRQMTGRPREVEVRIREAMTGAREHFRSAPSMTVDEALNSARVFELGGEGLLIRAMRYESPGFLEFLGSLNPLKQINDFVANWRRANLDRLREDHRHQEQMEALRQQARRDMAAERDLERKHALAMREKDLQIEAERLAFIRNRADQLPPALRDPVNAKLLEVAISAAASLAKDYRIGEMRVLPGGKEAA